MFSENYIYQNGDHYQKLNKSLTKRFWSKNWMLNCRKNQNKSIDAQFVSTFKQKSWNNWVFWVLNMKHFFFNPGNSFTVGADKNTVIHFWNRNGWLPAHINCKIYLLRWLSNYDFNDISTHKAWFILKMLKLNL